MGRRLVLRIKNPTGYHLILSDSKVGLFAEFERGFFDPGSGIGFIYYNTNQKIVFSRDYLEQLSLIGCTPNVIEQNLVPT